MEAPTEPRILFNTTENKQFCEVILNNPKALNAFDLHMASALDKQVDQWHNDGAKVTVFKGAGGKAFCAGGDVKVLYQIKKGLVEDPMINKLSDYFRTEFSCDFKVATMKPLQIAVWDGFVMGGGVGISIHAPVKIATEKSVFGMPEAKIGFFTDVGGGWFLSRLRNNIGIYLGLTSATLKGEDVVKAGIANYFVPSDQLEALQKDIMAVTNAGGVSQKSNEEITKEVYEVLNRYNQAKEGEIPNEGLINELFSKGSVDEIYKAIELSDVNKEFTLRTLKQLDGNSPLSLKVIYEQITRHKDITISDAFKSDFRTASVFMEGIDFFEGVRCLLVDRGDKPGWEFDNIEKVGKEEVEKYFKALDNDFVELDI